MAKLTTTDLVTLENDLSAVNTINANFTAVETAMENTVSRDGTTPNTMSADLDMNGNNILNLAAPGTSTEPVRVVDLEEYIDQINGTGGAVFGSPTAGEVNRIAKAASAGVVGYGQVEIDGSQNIYPTTNDVGALGKSGKAWADVFIASGGVLNFGASDYLITHSAGLLTLNGPLAITGALTGVTTLSTSSTGTFGGNVSVTGTATTSGNILPSVSNTPTLGSTTAMWGDLFLGDGGTVNFNNGDVALTHSADNLAVTGGSLQLAAGTTSVPPLKFTSGSNLTTPSAGAFEYDGVCIYFTPGAAGGRGLIGATHYVVLSSNYTLTAGTSLQPVFGSSNDTITLSANRAYEFEALLMFNTMTTTTRTMSFALLGTGSTATITTGWTSTSYNGASGAVITAAQNVTSTNTGATVINSTNTSATVTLLVKGIIRCTGSGTIIPSIQFSATPTGSGTNETLANSYFKITRIGTDTVQTIGAWA